MKRFLDEQATELWEGSGRVALGVVLVAGVSTGCGDNLYEPEGPFEPLVVMSYNLAGGRAKEAIANQIAQTAPDFAALQECGGCDDWLQTELSETYAVMKPRAGVAILYEPSRWEVIDSGTLLLGRNDDGWGERVAQWASFAAADEGRLYVYSTHWCVTVRRTNDACDIDRQLEYSDALLRHIEERPVPGAPVIVAGDFNVFDGFEDGAVVQQLLDSGLVDVFRTVDPGGDGTTFLGNSWAPSGRLDYIFTTSPVEVIDSYIDRETLDLAGDLDHHAVVGTVVL